MVNIAEVLNDIDDVEKLRKIVEDLHAHVNRMHTVSRNHVADVVLWNVLKHIESLVTTAATDSD